MVLRLLGSGSRYLSTITAQIYDLPLFIPLWWVARDGTHDGHGGTKLRKVMP